MRTSIYIAAAVAVAVAGFATAGAQNTGNPATPSRTQTPVRQPTATPPAARPMPSPQTSPTPARPAQPSPQATTPMPSQATQPMPQGEPVPPAQTAPTSPTSTAQQTVFPPDSRIDPNNPANNPAQRVPPASRGVGKPGRPDCSQMRGLEKSECERRDTTRDDLPAGVTSKQPEK